MNWIYRNNTDSVILFRNIICKPNEEITSRYPLPSSSGLTCVQEGSSPDPVILHEDIVIQGGEDVSVSVNSPELSRHVALSILCMTNDGGVECRFNSSNNKPVPIDTRGFIHTLDWEMCSKIFLHNPADTETIISITAVEVVD